MKLLETRVERSPAEVRLVGRVEPSTSGNTFEVYFSFPSAFEGFILRDAADPFVPALLLPSMAAGEELELVPPVSPRLLASLGRVQDIFGCWFPLLRKVEVRARGELKPPDTMGTGVGTLFSGGVDSFYTLLTSLKGYPGCLPVSHLLYMQGLETPLEKSKGLDQSRRRAEEIAAAMGKTLIRGETNLRTHFSLDYEYVYHGPALLSSALALSAGLKCIVVPSSYAYDQLCPSATHPLLDPLWSTERMEVLHDSCAPRRADKLALVGRDPIAQQYVRVCLRNDGGPYNCGRCRKCVRTMAMLELLGLLKDARTFPEALPDDFPTVLIEYGEDHLEEIRELGRKTGLKPDLTALVERFLRSRRRRRAVRMFMENTPLLDRLLPALLRYRERRSGT
jgi:hypothetical protein